MQNMFKPEIQHIIADPSKWRSCSPDHPPCAFCHAIIKDVPVRLFNQDKKTEIAFHPACCLSNSSIEEFPEEPIFIECKICKKDCTYRYLFLNRGLTEDEYKTIYEKEYKHTKESLKDLAKKFNISIRTMKHQFAKFHQEPNRTSKLHIFHPIPKGDELDFHGATFEKQFIEIWEIGMKNFNNGIAGFQTRWCITKQNQVSFSQLKDLKCWECKNFVLKHGECDPL